MAAVVVVVIMVLLCLWRKLLLLVPSRCGRRRCERRRPRRRETPTLVGRTGRDDDQAPAARQEEVQGPVQGRRGPAWNAEEGTGILRLRQKAVGPVAKSSFLKRQKVSARSRSLRGQVVAWWSGEAVEVPTQHTMAQCSQQLVLMDKWLELGLGLAGTGADLSLPDMSACSPFHPSGGNPP